MSLVFMIIITCEGTATLIFTLLMAGNTMRQIKKDKVEEAGIDPRRTDTR